MGIELVIVDDAPFIREAIRNCVESAGMKVIGEASNGDEAIDIVNSLQPDIVIMDLVLPQQNGVQVAAKLMAENPDLKIIACSTESQKDMVLKALHVGCKDFISKPFTSEGLKEKIIAVANA